MGFGLAVTVVSLTVALVGVLYKHPRFYMFRNHIKYQVMKGTAASGQTMREMAKAAGASASGGIEGSSSPASSASLPAPPTPSTSSSSAADNKNSNFLPLSTSFSSNTMPLHGMTPSLSSNSLSILANIKIEMPKVPGPDKYDYLKSTEENYCSPNAPFIGKYGSIRQNLDYNYHKHYSVERQEMHDLLIDQFLKTIVRDRGGVSTCEAPLEPWLVFTAGCMGAGKGHTMSWLSEQDLFPLDAFVKVDPDSLRELLPETDEYIKRNPMSAGFLTQKEVGYIAEVLTMDGLKLGKNVLIDGSLRDAEWYRFYITSLRQQFPTLKIAILYVTASVETILKRAHKRALKTGRVVPEEIILETISMLPSSLEKLTPLVDYVAAFENEDTPRFVYSYEGGIKYEPPSSATSMKNGGSEGNDVGMGGGDTDDWKASFSATWLMSCPMTPNRSHTTSVSAPETSTEH